MSYYEVLGLFRDATQSQIKEAYRNLALKYHPDINRSSEATIKMQEINNAYDTLNNPETKRRYDQTLSNDSHVFSNTPPVDTNEAWGNFIQNMNKYTKYQNDKSDYGIKMREDAMNHIIRDGLTILVDVIDLFIKNDG